MGKSRKIAFAVFFGLAAVIYLILGALH